MSERLVLDPADETEGRVEFDLTPFVGGAGPDFGDAAIEYYMAEAAMGSIPVDSRLPNRVVTIPLNLMEWGDLSFEEVRAAVQSKVGLWRREGGVLMREVNGVPLYLDVVGAVLKMGGSSAQAVQGVDPDAALTLETIPDWYGEELDLGDESGTGDVVVTLGATAGDHPSRARIVVTDTDGVRRRGVLWGVRSRHYDSAATAGLAYEAEAMTPADIATIATQSGASGGASNNVVTHASLDTDWTPVLLTDVNGVGALTHVGAYRVWARCSTTSTTPPRVRLAWDVGDLVNPVTNASVALPSAGQRFRLDLGAIRIDRAPLGTHYWRGMVQAAGASGGENISIDKVWLVPVDECWGHLRAPIEVNQGVQSFIARDPFLYSDPEDVLHGRTSAVGGAWSTAGDSGDFLSGGIGFIRRNASTDTGVVGRVATIGASTPSTVCARVDFSCSAVSGFLSGLLLRYVDVNNFVFAAVNAVAQTVEVKKVVSGTATTIGSAPVSLTTVDWYTIQTYIDTSGNVLAWFYRQGSAKGDPLIRARDSVLATGGALDDGKIGLYDVGSGTTVRAWDNLAAWVPEFDAVVHPGRSVEIQTAGVFREDADGNGYGPVAWVSGDIPRLPVSGMEVRTTEVLVAPSRGDLDQIPDDADDDFNVHIYCRPSWLFVPQVMGS